MSFKKPVFFVFFILLFVVLEARLLGGRWRQLNGSPVCFGAKGNQFGSFYVHAGKLAAIKLVHLYGYVSCLRTAYWSYWGCGITSGSVKDLVDIAITTSSNTMILPPSQFLKSGLLGQLKWSKVPGYNSLSPELVLSVFKDPYQLSSGQQLFLKYGEDMVDNSEADNGGKVCCDFYAL